MDNLNNPNKYNNTNNNNTNNFELEQIVLSTDQMFTFQKSDRQYIENDSNNLKQFPILSNNNSTIIAKNLINKSTFQQSQSRPDSSKVLQLISSNSKQQSFQQDSENNNNNNNNENNNENNSNSLGKKMNRDNTINSNKQSLNQSLNGDHQNNHDNDNHDDNLNNKDLNYFQQNILNNNNNNNNNSENPLQKMKETCDEQQTLFQSNRKKESQSNNNNNGSSALMSLKLIALIRKKIKYFYNNFTSSGRKSYLQNNNIRKTINDRSDIIQLDKNIFFLFRYWYELKYRLQKLDLRVSHYINLFDPHSMFSYIILRFFAFYNAIFYLVFSIMVIFHGPNWFETIWYPITLIIWVFEALYHMNTKIYLNNELISDRYSIITNYFKSRAVYDFISFILVAALPNIENATNFFYTVSFIKLVNTMYDYDEIQKDLIMQVKNYYMVSLVNLIIQVFVIGHIIACMYYLVGQIELKWMGLEETWYDQGLGTDYVWWKLYLEAMYWSLTLLTTGSNVAFTLFQMFFTTFIMIFTTIIFGYLLNVTGVIISSLNEQNENLRKDLNIINDYMRNNRISKSLQSRVNTDLENYYMNNLNKQKDEEENIISKISPSLRDLIKVEYCGQIFDNFPVIREKFSKETLQKLYQEFQENHYLPNQIIFVEGEPNDLGLMYIAQGSVSLKQSFLNDIQTQKTLTILKKGDIFGAVNFFTGQAPDKSAISNEFTRVVRINRNKFIEIVKEDEKDYQVFCQIKDRLLTYEDFEAISQKCLFCHNSTHLEAECHLIHIQKDAIYQKLKFYEKNIQNRQVFSRKSSYLKTYQTFMKVKHEVEFYREMHHQSIDDLAIKFDHSHKDFEKNNTNTDYSDDEEEEDEDEEYEDDEEDNQNKTKEEIDYFSDSQPQTKQQLLTSSQQQQQQQKQQHLNSKEIFVIEEFKKQDFHSLRDNENLNSKDIQIEIKNIDTKSDEIDTHSQNQFLQQEIMQHHHFHEHHPNNNNGNNNTNHHNYPREDGITNATHEDFDISMYKSQRDKKQRKQSKALSFVQQDSALSHNNRKNNNSCLKKQSTLNVKGGNNHNHTNDNYLINLNEEENNSSDYFSSSPEKKQKRQNVQIPILTKVDSILTQQQGQQQGYPPQQKQRGSIFSKFKHNDSNNNNNTLVVNSIVSNNNTSNNPNNANNTNNAQNKLHKEGSKYSQQQQQQYKLQQSQLTQAQSEQYKKQQRYSLEYLQDHYKLSKTDLNQQFIYTEWCFDKLNDYKYYFPTGNSKVIFQRYVKYQRKKVKLYTTSKKNKQTLMTTNKINEII